MDKLSSLSLICIPLCIIKSYKFGCALQTIPPGVPAASLLPLRLLLPALLLLSRFLRRPRPPFHLHTLLVWSFASVLSLFFVSCFVFFCSLWFSVSFHLCFSLLAISLLSPLSLDMYRLSCSPARQSFHVVGYLETQLACCTELGMGSAEEYVNYLTLYISFLTRCDVAEVGVANRLSDVFRGLLGPVHVATSSSAASSSATSSSSFGQLVARLRDSPSNNAAAPGSPSTHLQGPAWSPTIFGLQKRAILRNCLPLLVYRYPSLLATLTESLKVCDDTE